MSQTCTDPVVGGILAGWRYDISGLAPDMRGDYEQHLTECQRCRSRQRLHRQIDIGLIALTSLSALVFLVAFGAIRYLAPRHSFVLELVALAGFLISAAVWVLVAVTTPAPMVVADAALVLAGHVHSRLPEEIRNRIPEELRLKLSDQ